MSMKSQSNINTPVAIWQPFADALHSLFAGYHLQLINVPDKQSIPGSFWGDSEAGLAGNKLYLRPDTPLHSALHEAGHYICMDPDRRLLLHTNAGGDYDEENAVCYLQAIMADTLPQYDRFHLFADMDAWGYSFRLGSAQAWFEQDAEDARLWLVEHEIIDSHHNLTGKLHG